MKKIKLCGVSLCTLLAAGAANAAGYTCEELIEYTSCMPGYYLLGSCPTGSVYYEKACENSGGLHATPSEEYCEQEEEGSFYYENKCHILSPDGFSESTVDFASFICSQCPTGAICAGGTEDKTPCPAGSYCATTGLAEPTDTCAKGLYSYSGATVCLSCPTFPKTDKDGNAVVATTAGKGASSASECYISSDVYFQDAIGTWHFKSNCNAFDSNTATEAEKIARCESLGGRWEYSSWYERDVCSSDDGPSIETEEECYASGNAYWSDGDCYCDWWVIDIETGDIKCE